MACFIPGRVIRSFEVDGKSVVFRYPKRTDAPGMLEYINSMVEERTFSSKQKKATLPEERKWLKDKLEQHRKGSEILVCVEIDGKYKGSGHIRVKPLEAEKHVVSLGIGIHKGFRGLGIGSRLMETMEGIARKDLKARILELDCFSINNRAMHLYENLGFREVGRIPGALNHYGKYCDKVLMYKVLK
jgi:RimJ/RimL family protein N-acetyltransferase